MVIMCLKDPSSMIQDSIEPVDKEVAQRDGVFIHHLSKSFPPPKKDGKPTVAVNDFSAALYVIDISLLSLVMKVRLLFCQVIMVLV